MLRPRRAALVAMAPFCWNDERCAAAWHGWHCERDTLVRKKDSPAAVLKRVYPQAASAAGMPRAGLVSWREG